MLYYSVCIHFTHNKRRHLLVKASLLFQGIITVNSAGARLHALTFAFTFNLCVRRVVIYTRTLLRTIHSRTSTICDYAVYAVLYIRSRTGWLTLFQDVRRSQRWESSLCANIIQCDCDGTEHTNDRNRHNFEQCNATPSVTISRAQCSKCL